MCPLCQSKKVRCARVKWWDFLFVIVQAQPMRCRSCQHRFYRWPWSAFGHQDSSWRPARSTPLESPKPAVLTPQKRSAATASGKR